MNKIILLSKVLLEHPTFSNFIEWKSTDKDVFCKNEQFGAIFHGVVCDEHNKPIYDLPIIDFKECSIIIPYFIDNKEKISKILLIKSERPASGLNLWEFPGGFLNKNESPEKAALRELSEETLFFGKTVKFLGRLITERAMANKPETYVFASPCSVKKESNQEIKDLRESQILEQKLFSVEEVDQLFSKSQDYCGSTLAAWSLFKINF
jgi:ADP-ribose pyrophosphatase YjhB (NUDIX family)